MKKKAFPNEYWINQQEYFDFVDKHKVFGKEACELKKKMDKQINIPEPKIFKEKRLS
jgi:hypothetical protein